MRKPSTLKKPLIPHEYLPVIREAQEKAKTVTVNRDYDIPYVAGYSVDGDTVYWDRHFPMFMTYKGRRVSIRIPICTHEMVEKGLEDNFNLKYIKAHNIATYFESLVVKKMGIPWEYYDKFCQKYIKKIGSERIRKVPIDLDLKPYEDEHDEKIVNKLKEAMK